MLNLELLTTIYPDELRKEAANHRLVSLVRQHSVKKKYSYAMTLAWLGGRLCKWGYLLQQRFENAGTIPPSETMKNGIKV